MTENCLAHFVSDMVDELDPSAMYTVHEKDAQGQPPYNAGGGERAGLRDDLGFDLAEDPDDADLLAAVE